MPLITGAPQFIAALEQSIHVLVVEGILCHDVKLGGDEMLGYSPHRHAWP